MRAEHINEWITIEECVHGGFYKIHGRNFGYGVCIKGDGRFKTQFYGIRYKFGDRFLDGEIHLDENDRYGTAKPLEFIEACPYNYDDNYTELFEYIEKKEQLLGE